VLPEPPLAIESEEDYLLYMDIQSLSMESAQTNLLEQVSTSMLAKELKGSQEQAVALLQSLPPLPEGSGSLVDLLA